MLGLYEKTTNGELAWKKTPEERVYSLAFSRHSIQIAMQWEFYRDVQERYEAYTLSILDDNGELIEVVGPADFEETDFPGPPYQVFKEIYESARRYGKGMNEAVDIILRELFFNNPY